ncbi:response regulator transcription factor [Phenylobacterium sp. VNQ135]|uniref:response regulator transcription factor n=1 Tax=Phenylobacterium sp. VNQ135 TaxID=3400922 RepID=UPI003C10CC3A
MRVAVLEDEGAQADLVVRTLTLAGHNCVPFTTGPAIMAKLRQETFDLLILDWNVPGGLSGLDVATWARAHLSPPPPILMVTARSDAEDIVAGLNAGADDFLVKPIDPSVLLARVHAVLRRAYPPELESRPEAFGGVVFDPLSRVVSVDGEEVQLTAKEFDLALVLFRNMHRALGRSYLLETVWGRNPDLATRTLDAHVSKIRAKLGLRPDRGFKLAPVYSYGYRLERVSDESGGSETV